MPKHSASTVKDAFAGVVPEQRGSDREDTHTIPTVVLEGAISTPVCDAMDDQPNGETIARDFGRLAEVASHVADVMPDLLELGWRPAFPSSRDDGDGYTDLFVHMRKEFPTEAAAVAELQTVGLDPQVMPWSIIWNEKPTKESLADPKQHPLGDFEHSGELPAA